MSRVTMLALADAPTAIRCARCGHDCSGEAWGRLPRLNTLSPDELTAWVRPWPVDVVVEVRSCAGCSAPIARTARRSHL